MDEHHAIDHHNAPDPEREELGALVRCLTLLGWCAFLDQRWSEAAALFRSAQALVVQLKQGGPEEERSRNDHWCQEQLLAELETMCLHLVRVCLLRTDDSAWRRSERTQVNDLLKAPLSGSRRVRRPKA